MAASTWSRPKQRIRIITELTLTANNLACDRGGVRIFANLSFTLTSGKFMEVRGPNGSGKSSLLRLLAGLNNEGGGKLDLQGGNAELTVGQQAHYIAHQDAIKPALSVVENLAFWSRFLNHDRALDQALAAFSLQALANHPAGMLSAGQKRRLALTRLTLAARPLWLLDEPSVGLDSQSQGQLQNLMQSHIAGGGLIMATTHVPLGLAPDHSLTMPGRQP